jgi:hypothetical protein
MNWDLFCPNLCNHLDQNGYSVEWTPCGAGYTGFLCGQCANGFQKIGGKCIPCSTFDWGMLLQVRNEFFSEVNDSP